MTSLRSDKPLIALTIGDVAGIGPEVVVRACLSPIVREACIPLVVGHPAVVKRAIALIGSDWDVETLAEPDEQIAEKLSALDCRIPCWNPGSDAVADVPSGAVDARAGRAAYDYLVAATDYTLAGIFDGITTAPLNKAALREAGLKYPGHTEVLAERCGVDQYAMMLYLPPGEIVRGSFGLGVAHVTLHTSIKSVPELLSVESVHEKIHLMDQFLHELGCAEPRVGVAALNPHAGEGGLFGDEEARIIEPAVVCAQREGINAQGPFPADTLFKRAVLGEFDGIVAMYHDQGHIALKLIGWNCAVNITLGIPVVRTSPSHGTAFDIAWTGLADAEGMIDAVVLAARLAKSRRSAIQAER